MKIEFFLPIWNIWVGGILLYYFICGLTVYFIDREHTDRLALIIHIFLSPLLVPTFIMLCIVMTTSDFIEDELRRWFK